MLHSFTMFLTLLEKKSAKVSGKFSFGITIELKVNVSGNCAMFRPFAFFTAVHKDLEFPGKMPLRTIVVLLSLRLNFISLLMFFKSKWSLKFEFDLFLFNKRFFLLISAFNFGVKLVPVMLPFSNVVNGAISSIISNNVFS